MKTLHYTEIVQGSSVVTFDRTAPAYFSLRPPPRLVFGVPSIEFPFWYYNDRGVQECGVLAVDDLHILGTDVLIADGYRIRLPQCGINQTEELLTLDDQLTKSSLNIRDISGQAVVLPGPAYDMYGHWLIDFLPRLANLRAIGHSMQDLIFVLPTSLPSLHRSWLKLLGIEDQHMLFYNPSTECCRIEHALIPFGLRGNSRVQPMLRQAATWMRNSILPTSLKPAVNRIFVSRQKWGNSSRVLVNEDELTRCAYDLGFQIVSPEQLDLVDQVNMFAGACIVVGDYGSALHNSIFCPSSAKVIALRGTFGHPGFLQSGLCEALQQQCSYIFGKTRGSDIQQEYNINIDEFRLCINLIIELPDTITHQYYDQ